MYWRSPGFRGQETRLLVSVAVSDLLDPGPWATSVASVSLEQLGKMISWASVNGSLLIYTHRETARSRRPSQSRVQDHGYTSIQGQADRQTDRHTPVSYMENIPL